MSQIQSPTTESHIPVLLEEAVAALALRENGIYIDATFGGGGHTRAILKTPVGVGRLLAIDADEAAIERAAQIQQEFGERFTFLPGNFGDLESLVRRAGVEQVDGVLMDLGLSSFQLDTPDRGFAFRHDAPLDMRFDQTSGLSAADLVAEASETDLANIIYRLGEDPASRRIARAIVQERERQPIQSTTQLAALVERAVGGRKGKATHPATRTFQALRMEINRELDVLKSGLEGALNLLAPGGRLVVISFHSLEDRLVKRFIEAESATCTCPPELPVCICGAKPRLRKIGKAIKPSAAEQAANPRSRSAIMRIAQRTATENLPAGDQS